MKIIFTLTLILIASSCIGQNQFTNKGNFKINPGTHISFFGNFNNSGKFVDNGESIDFSGTSNQTISGDSIATFKNISFFNTAGTTINQDVYITNSIDLKNTVLTLNSNILKLASAVDSIGRTSGYVVSELTDNSAKVQWNIGINTGNYIFPFGNIGGDYIPFIMNLTSGDIGIVTVSTYTTDFNNLPYPTSPTIVTSMADSLNSDIAPFSTDRFWQVDKDGPSGTATLTFTATSAETAFTFYNLKARHWNNALNKWDEPLPSQTSISNSATVPNVTTFSPWTLTGIIVALPIEIVSFSAELNEENTVDLNWITESEMENDFFSIDKSTDLINYVNVCIEDGAGTTNSIQHYANVDLNPYGGISYYRLKQTDFNGTVRYSEPISVNVKENKIFSASVFPNPTKIDDITVLIKNPARQNVTIKINDLSGKQLYSSTNSIVENETLNIKLPTNENITSGIYVITISDGINLSTEKIILY